jgi:hypothetical protein
MASKRGSFVLPMVFSVVAVGSIILAMNTYHYNVGVDSNFFREHIGGDVFMTAFEVACFIPIFLIVAKIRTPRAAIVAGILSVLATGWLWIPTALDTTDEFIGLVVLYVVAGEWVAYWAGRLVMMWEARRAERPAIPPKPV